MKRTDHYKVLDGNETFDGDDTTVYTDAELLFCTLEYVINQCHLNKVNMN